MEKEVRYSKLKEVPENPFRKDMITWYPSAKKLYMIAKSWKEIVGSPLCDMTQLLGVYNDSILQIACKDSELAQEMRLRKKSILNKINSHFGDDFISEIKLNISKYTKKEEVVEDAEKTITIDDVELSTEKLKEIEDKLVNLPTDEIKNKVREIYINNAKQELIEKIR